MKNTKYDDIFCYFFSLWNVLSIYFSRYICLKNISYSRNSVTFVEYHNEWVKTSKMSLLVQVGFTNDASISGGDLGQTFKAAQFHFHWGSDNNKGSEHTYNGKSYPAEVRYRQISFLGIELFILRTLIYAHVHDML